MNTKKSSQLLWLLVFFSGCFEVVWVTGLKYSTTPLQWMGTIIAIIVSFYLLIFASIKLPASTVYAVFVGLGTAGTVIMEMTVFKEPVSLPKLLFLTTLIIGIIGLKLVTPDEEKQQGGQVT